MSDTARRLNGGRPSDRRHHTAILEEVGHGAPLSFLTKRESTRLRCVFPESTHGASRVLSDLVAATDYHRLPTRKIIKGFAAMSDPKTIRIVLDVSEGAT